jgi:hypothetical protein
VGPFSLHTTTLPEAARSRTVAISYWIGHASLLVGSGLVCGLGGVPGLEKADVVCTRLSSILTLYLSVVAVIAIILFFISAK